MSKIDTNPQNSDPVCGGSVSHRHNELDFPDAESCPYCECDDLRDSNARLRALYDNLLSSTTRPIADETKRLRQEVEHLRALLREASVYVPVNDLDPLTLPDRIRAALEK